MLVFALYISVRPALLLRPRVCVESGARRPSRPFRTPGRGAPFRPPQRARRWHAPSSREAHFRGHRRSSRSSSSSSSSSSRSAEGLCGHRRISRISAEGRRRPLRRWPRRCMVRLLPQCHRPLRAEAQARYRWASLTGECATAQGALSQGPRACASACHQRGLCVTRGYPWFHRARTRRTVWLLGCCGLGPHAASLGSLGLNTFFFCSAVAYDDALRPVTRRSVFSALESTKNELNTVSKHNAAALAR